MNRTSGLPLFVRLEPLIAFGGVFPLAFPILARVEKLTPVRLPYNCAEILVPMRSAVEQFPIQLTVRLELGGIENDDEVEDELSVELLGPTLGTI